MLTVSASTQTALANTVTRPIILAEIGFSVILHLSSAEEVEWNSQTWEGGRLINKGVDLSPTKAGGRQGSLSIANHDNAISAIILSEGATGKSCTLWYLYGDAPYTSNEAVKIFEGAIDGAQLDDVARLDIISEGNILWTPRITFTASRFPHIKKAGAEITWGGQKFVLKGPDSR